MRNSYLEGEYNIKVDLIENGRNDVGWIHLLQYRVQWRVLMNLGVP
jgi:hypothetical protein